MTEAISRSEQADLLRLIRQRERVAKTAAAQRAAQLRADFETQLDRKYSFNERPVWAAAFQAAQAATDEAASRIADECERLGIPKEFAPSISLTWYARGENAVKERRIELRRLAHVHIEAAEKRTRTEIERMSLQAQTDLIATGLSQKAKAFLVAMPSVDTLMPGVQVDYVERLLISSKDRSCDSFT